MIWLFLLAGLALILFALELYSILKDRTDEGPSYWRKESLPLSIEMYKDISSCESIVHAIEDAVSFWNDSLGLTVFTRDSSSKGSTVSILPYPTFISFGMKEHHPYICSRIESDKGTITSALIYLDREYAEDASERDSDTLSRSIAHELGHVLGLEDDWFAHSVMYCNHFPQVAEITPKDKAILHTFYGS